LAPSHKLPPLLRQVVGEMGVTLSPSPSPMPLVEYNA
jgi:hypothetical protein